MPKRLQVYQTDDLIVTFDPNVCTHSAVCLGALPAVFDVSRRQWIALDKGGADEIVQAVGRCPSGALHSVRAGKAAGGSVADRDPDPVRISLRPDGPLLVMGAVEVTMQNGDVVAKERCSLCRCGHTAKAPFCDGTHRTIEFKAPS